MCKIVWIIVIWCCNLLMVDVGGDRLYFLCICSTQSQTVAFFGSIVHCWRQVTVTQFSLTRIILKFHETFLNHSVTRYSIAFCSDQNHLIPETPVGCMQMTFCTVFSLCFTALTLLIWEGHPAYKNRCHFSNKWQTPVYASFPGRPG